jgi:hypothetical protein
MATHTKCLRAAGLLALTIVFAAAFSNRARADDLGRIRPESRVLSAAMVMASGRSATFRSLVERIEQSDVIVYLTCERFDASTLSGRTALAAAQPGVRYLRVQIRCQQSDQALAAIIGHELQHVVEIASTASVVDEPSFARLFSTIGFPTCRSPRVEQFETMAALHTGERVRWELSHYVDLSALASDHTARRVAASAD